MILDLPTLIWFMALTSFTLAAAVLVVGWRSRAADGLTAWGAAVAVHGLSYPLFALRFNGWLDLSIILTCMLTSATLSLNILALSQFQRSQRPPPRDWMLWFPVLASGLIASLTLQHHILRNVVIALVACPQALLLAQLAAHPVTKDRRERSRSLLVAGSVALVGLLLIRALVLARLNGWANDSLGVPADVQAYSYVFALMILIFNTVGFLLMHKDRALEVQREQASQDPLTGLLNRRALMQELQRVIAMVAAIRQSVSVLMIDIDRFKQVNDSYGHRAGDEVLLAVCERIHGRLRRSDLLARFGGEEFLVVLPETKAEDALRVAEEIRQVVAACPVFVAAGSVPVTVSIGIRTLWPMDVDDVTDRLILDSDKAMYLAKRAGRDRVEVYRDADLVSG